LTLKNKKKKSQALWDIPVIPALERLREEDQKFKARLDYIVSARSIWVTTERPCLKIQKPTN
jgi:hypothetical protein